MANFEQWAGFKGRKWTHSVDVRDFIAHRDRRARQQPERGPLCRAACRPRVDFSIKTVKPPSPHLLLRQVRPALFAKGSPIRGAGERMRD